MLIKNNNETVFNFELKLVKASIEEKKSKN